MGHPTNVELAPRSLKICLKINVFHELQKIHISENFSKLNLVEYMQCMVFSPFLGFLDNSPHLIWG